MGAGEDDDDGAEDVDGADDEHRSGGEMLAPVKMKQGVMALADSEKLRSGTMKIGLALSLTCVIVPVYVGIKDRGDEA